MPDWNPNWEDVRWSHPAADAARNALQRAADLVERTNGERGRAAVTAVGFWQGAHRTTFDQQLVLLGNSARDVATALRDAAAAIGRAALAAQEEQNRRERERQRWNDERDAERREDERRNAAAAAAATPPPTPAPTPITERTSD